MLGIKDPVFAGWSLGGHIVVEAEPHLPDAAGFAIFGTPPLPSPAAASTSRRCGAARCRWSTARVHAPHEEAPEAFAALLMAFVDDLH